MSEKSSKASLGGAKKLTLVDAVAQSVGFMGPVFSIAFLVPLVVGISSASQNGAGNAAALSVVFAAIGVIGLGWIIAEYTKKIQAAGSLYTYVSDGLGGRVGSAVGWLYYTGILALSAGILVMIGGTVHDTLLGEFNFHAIPYVGWDLILFALVAGVMYLGVALSTRLQLVLALISVTVVFIFSLYVMLKSGGLHHIGTGFSPSSSPTHWKGVLFGMLYGVLLFTGFESSANLGEETDKPERNIPRAVLFSVIAIAVFYVIGSFAQVAGFHFNLSALGKANAAGPLFVLASPSAQGGFASVAIRRLVELVVVFDMIAVLIGTAVAASRGVFALARDERLPKQLTSVSKRGTPTGATLIVLLGYVVVGALALWSTSFAIPGLPEYVSLFSWMSTYGGFAITIIYLLIAVGALRGLKNHPSKAKLYGACTVAIIVAGAAIFGGVYKVTAPTEYAPWVAVIILIVGLIVASVMPKSPEGIADYSPLIESERGPLKL
jgi:amino acid transporter